MLYAEGILLYWWVFTSESWVRVRGFSKVVATFKHVGRSFIYGHHRGRLNNPIFSNLGLCAACGAHFMCPHELWLTLVSHPFSLNSSLGFAGGKCYQKITIPIFRLVLQNFVSQVTFLIFFSIAIFYPYFLQVGLLLQYVAPFQSGTSKIFRIIVSWCRVAISNEKSTPPSPKRLLN